MLNDFLLTLKGKSVSIIGAGVSNTPLIRMLWDIAALTVHDKKKEEDFDPEFLAELKLHNVKLVTGDGYLDEIYGDVIFRTPGVRPDVPALERAKARGSVVTSEMDVFFSLCPCPITAITGSDGKTTTSTLVSEMYKAQGFTVHLGGNIGTPLLPRLDEISAEDRVVVELSSFQLMDMTHSPHIAIVTNVTPNHLDWHRGMDEYTEAKERLLQKQTQSDICILNLDDPTTRQFAQRAQAKVGFFSMSKQEKGFSFDGENLLRDGKAFLKASELRIPGKHNIANFLAASAAVCGEVSEEALISVAKNFTGVEHRIEFVRELDGVKYYNDSIASSPTRAAAALACFENIILIAGGYDKKIAFDQLGELICQKVDKLLLCGVTAQQIKDAVIKAPCQRKPEIIIFPNLTDTILTARKLAKSGDVVLFSPACASFDQFVNFAVRGRFFKDVVNSLKEV